MRIFAFVIAVLFVSSANAKDMIPGKYLARTLAHMCKEETFKEFAKATQDERMLASEYPKAKLDIEGKTVVIREMGLKVWKDEKEFKASFENKTYSGSDACDLITNMIKADDKQASLFSLFVEDAHARSLFRQEKLGYLTQAGIAGGIAGGVAGGASAATGPAAIVIGGGTAAVVGGAMFYDDWSKAVALEDLLNADFKVTCSSSEMTIIGGGYKLVGYKVKDAKSKQVLSGHLIKEKTGSTIKKSDNFQTWQNLGDFVYRMAYACNSDTDAQIIKANISAEQQKVSVLIDWLHNSVHYMKGSTPDSKVLKTK